MIHSARSILRSTRVGSKQCARYPPLPLFRNAYAFKATATAHHSTSFHVSSRRHVHHVSQDAGDLLRDVKATCKQLRSLLSPCMGTAGLEADNDMQSSVQGPRMIWVTSMCLCWTPM